jgi:hypothetical protein
MDLDVNPIATVFPSALWLPLQKVNMFKTDPHERKRPMLDRETRERILSVQRNEITEHHICRKLSLTMTSVINEFLIAFRRKNLNTIISGRSLRRSRFSRVATRSGSTSSSGWKQGNVKVV